MIWSRASLPDTPASDGRLRRAQASPKSLGDQSVKPRLWDEVHDLFDTDDGSLPEIRVDYTNARAMVRGYAFLRARASRIVPENAAFWSKTHAEERPIDSVSSAAGLVASGKADAFHVLLAGIQVNGVAIPDLGVFVFPDQLALDYRMGPSWGPAEVEALFQLLAELTAFDSRATLSHHLGPTPEAGARFQEAWHRHCADNAS